MSAKLERYSGLLRGQTTSSASSQSAGTLEADSFRTPTPSSRRNTAEPLQSGSKLRSGITITFPENRAPLHDDIERNSTYTVGRPQREPPPGLEWKTQSHRGERSTPSSSRQVAGSTDRSHNRGRRSRGGQRVTVQEEERLQKEMKSLKAAAKTSLYWLTITWKRQLEVEKGMAEEQARQAERQAQSLMEERAWYKAEKEALERSQNEMVARIQMLEGMISESDALRLESDDDIPFHPVDLDNEFEAASLIDGQEGRVTPRHSDDSPRGLKE